MIGLTDYATYIPAFELSLKEITNATGRPVSGASSRSVAFHDEDTTTLAVEAGRNLARVEGGWLYFATSAPTYQEKSNATTIGTVLGMDPSTVAVDLTGLKSGFNSLGLAAQTGGVAVQSHVSLGLPGSADELFGGDGSAAFSFAGADPLATVRHIESESTEIQARWKEPGRIGATSWEERFAADALDPIVQRTVEKALAGAGVAAAEINWVGVASPNPKLAHKWSRMAASPHEWLVDEVGFAGAAHLGLALADILDSAAPGDVILLVSITDGCDVMILEAQAALAEHVRNRGPRAATATRKSILYHRYLLWKGLLEPEPPRRPAPLRTSSPAAFRNVDWKFELVASRCLECGTVHMPPQRVCISCASVDRMERKGMSNQVGTIALLSSDYLRFSVEPPVVGAWVDFDDGGRLKTEVTDAVEGELKVGDRVGMSFRHMSTAEGIRNYFWKARRLAG